MKIGDLFANQKRLFGVLTDNEKKKYFQLLGLHFLGTLIELLGLIVLYLLILVVLDFQSFEQVYSRFFANPTPSVTNSIIGLVVAYLAKTLLFLFIGKVQLNQLFNLNRSIAFRSFGQSLEMDLIHQKQQKIAERINEVSQVTNMLPYVVLLPSVLIISELIFVAIAIAIMLIYSPILVLAICIALIPQSIALIWWGRRKLASLGKEITDGGAVQNQLIENTLYGYPEITLWNLKPFFVNRFESITDNLYHKRVNAQWIGAVAPQRLMEVLTVIALAVVAFFVKSEQEASAINGVLALFAAIAFRLLPSFNRIVNSTNTFNTYASMLGYIFSKNTDKSKGEVKNEIIDYKSLKIKDIKFNFSSEITVLNNFSLEINKGDFVAIIGESGRGKTTLLNLILGFYEPSDGEILVNEIPLNQAKESWHNIIGLVRQDAYVLPGSLMDNIAFGQESVNLEKVNHVLNQVRLEPWVNELPNGLDTLIGDHGALVSGGQKQRIAIARALYRNPEVLVLDEVTTALDDGNKEVIWSILSDLNKSGTTIIMVSHDKSGLNNVTKTVDLT